MGIDWEPIDGECGEILKRTFVNKIRKGYMRIKGCVFTQRYAEMAEDILNLEVYDDDVWVCSFPKSGTTWTQEMTWLIANDCNYKGAEENIGARFPFLELSSIFDYRDILGKEKDFKPPPFLEDSVTFIKNMQRPRLIKTHVPWNLLPLQIQNAVKKPKIIYVARNPKDTCVSYYHHCISIEGYTGNFEEFCKLFLCGAVTFGPYWKNVLPYWEQRANPNVLFLTYENMIKELGKNIKTVSKFLDKTITDNQLKQLEQHLSFESMKTNKAVNYQGLIDLNRKFKLVEGPGSFMRAGAVGGYKETMSAKLIKQFDEWIETNTKGTGLKFDT